MIKQNQPYGCGLYSVANTLRFSTFITKERLEKSKKGNTIGQLSKWLQDDGISIYIDSLYYNHLGKKLPTTCFGYRPINQKYMPVLFNVRYKKDGMNHLVGGKIDEHGNLYLMDSLKDNIVKTTISKINKLYEEVYGLFIFMNLEDGSYVFLSE